MTRMIDRLPSGDWIHGERDDFAVSTIGTKIQELVSQSPIIIADDAMMYVMQNCMKDKSFEIDFSTLPNVAPPFETFWIEARAGAMTISKKENERWVEIVKTYMAYAMGCAFRAVDPKVALGCSESNYVNRCARENPSAKWIYDCQMISEHYKRSFFPLGNLALAVGDRGQPLGIARTEHEDDEDTKQNKSINFWAFIMFTALSFCHCRNVKLLPSDPNPKLDKARVRRGEKPLFQYHTILIDGARRLFEQHLKAGSGIHQAMHLCRGHFKTFTDERPLLGRHVGTWWWGEQVRGDESKGVVVKDYRAKHISELAAAESANKPVNPKAEPRHMLQIAAMSAVSSLK